MTEDSKLEKLIAGVHALEVEIAKIGQKVERLIQDTEGDRVTHDDHETRIVRIEGSMTVLKWISGVAAGVTTGSLMFFITALIQQLRIGG